MKSLDRLRQWCRPLTDRHGAAEKDGDPLVGQEQTPDARDGAAIRTEGLVRDFGDVRAVDGVDLAIAPGEIYGFLGPNGAGKSTTVRVLCTLLAPTAGQATVAGYDVAQAPGAVRLRIGAALQEAALDPRQTGAELLRLQGLLYGLPKDTARRRAAELGELIGLTDALDRRIGTYSGGMKRRLDLAAALVHNPEILFLDEPTTGLDPLSRVTVWDEVRRLNGELGMTILLTTQYLEEADELAHRVGIIDRGRLVGEGTPAELKRSVGADVIVARVDGEAKAVCAMVEHIPGVQGVEAHGNELVVATEDGSATISPVAVALAGCEMTVRDLTLRTPTLDDVFLDLTGTHIRDDRDDDGEAQP
jgi:ABC-2 type transport system ATP-binding protein